MATLIKPTGEELALKPKGKKFSLKELQEAVGGYIELIHLPDGREAFVNEEGKLKGLSMNLKATELYGRGHDYIVGNMLIIEKGEVRGASRHNLCQRLTKNIGLYIHKRPR